MKNTQTIEQDYQWVLSTIKSCSTPFQIKGAFNLIQSFSKKYPGELYMIDWLTEILVNKQAAITNNNENPPPFLPDENAMPPAASLSPAIYTNNNVINAIKALYVCIIVFMIMLGIVHVINQ